MSYAPYSNRGPINPPQMPMPQMPQSTYSQSTGYPSTHATNTPYAASYPGSGHGTTTQSHGVATQSSANSDIDRWMNEVIKNLTGMVVEATRQDLEVLVNNEDKLIELVQSTQEVKLMQAKRKELIESNKDQAVTNISLEPEIEVMKNELLQLIEEHNTLKEKQLSLFSQLSSQNSIDSTLAVLQAATSEKETETDKCSQEFIDGNLTIEDFIEKFVTERTLYQLRKIKSEKLNNMIHGGTTNRPPNRPVPTQRPQASQMPMPGAYNYRGGYMGYQ